MGETWFITDPHLGGHERVAATRGFTVPAEHDAFIIRNIARRVRPGDALWILGDFALGGWRQALQMISVLPCELHLVGGNHDRVHPAHSNAHKYQAEYLQVFDSVQPFATLKRDGVTFMMSHFPYEGEGERDIPERFTQYRLRDLGQPLIHGHTHSSTKVSRSSNGTPMLHAGLDARGLKPVTLHTLWTELVALDGPDPGAAAAARKAAIRSA